MYIYTCTVSGERIDSVKGGSRWQKVVLLKKCLDVDNAGEMVRWTIFTLRAGWIAFSANSEAILCLVSDSRSLDSWQCALTYIRSAGKNDSRQFVIIGGHRGNVSVHLFFPAFQQGCKIDYGITENEGGIDNFFLSLISKQNFSRGKNPFRVPVSCSIPRVVKILEIWERERGKGRDRNGK